MNDSVVYPLIILPLFLFIFLVARLFTVLLHELGHAIPARIFTNQKVTIFLGSYGDMAKSRLIRFNDKLYLYFRLNPLKWRGGMVRHTSNNLSTYKHLAILLMGPLFSLIFALIALYIVFSYDLNGFFKLLTVIFSLSAIIDLRNIYPAKKQIVLFDGSFIYNDGAQILRLLKAKKESKKILRAWKLYANENYAQTIEILEDLNHNYINVDVLNIAVNALVQLKEFSRAKVFYSKFINSVSFQKLDSNGFFSIGLVESRLNENELALGYYNKSIELNSRNVYSLSNRGYTYNLFEKYDEALTDFDYVININPDSSYAYANRAYSKIKLKLFAEALIDIEKALSINDKDAYGFKNWGIYYLELKDYKKAWEKLQIAYEIDPDVHMINDYMQVVKDKLGVKAL